MSLKEVMSLEEVAELIEALAAGKAAGKEGLKEEPLKELEQLHAALRKGAVKSDSNREFTTKPLSEYIYRSAEEPPKAKRFNTGKVEFDDIPLIGIVEVSKVADYGRSKYGKQNWRQEASNTQYLNCAMRHLIKYMYGEEIDSESKCKHIAHSAWNLLALLEKQMMGKEVDDRFVYDSDVNIEDLFKVQK